MDKAVVKTATFVFASPKFVFTLLKSVFRLIQKIFLLHLVTNIAIIIFSDGTSKSDSKGGRGMEGLYMTDKQWKGWLRRFKRDLVD